MNTTGARESVMDVLGDASSRKILVALTQQRRSVSDLVECCELSQSTVHRRIQQLEQHGLIEKHAIVAEGCHYYLYESDVKGVFLRLDDTAFEIALLEDAKTADAIDEFIQKPQ